MFEIKYEDELPIINMVARGCYDKKTYDHAARVATFVKEDPRVMVHDYNFRYYCEALAICHDLFEDTDCPEDAFDEDLTEGIKILTRRPDESYNDYCDRVCMRDSEYFATDIELAAWYVKMADMKDHLTQTATLTDKLKAKYLEGMAHLL